MIRCLFKKTDMTPCVIEDGPLCFDADGPWCVGCARTADTINEDLAARGHAPVLPDPPAGRRPM